MYICDQCHNNNQNRLKWEKHIFKDKTYHIKVICLECCYSRYVKRDAIGYENTIGEPWVVDHSKRAAKERRKQIKANFQVLMDL